MGAVGGWFRRVASGLGHVSTVITFLQVFGYWNAAVLVFAPVFAFVATMIEGLPYSLVGVAVFCTLAATSSFVMMNKARPASQSAPEVPAYAAWAQVDEFMLFQAACLWADVEPKYPLPRGNAYAYFTMIKEAVRNRTISIRGNLREHLATIQGSLPVSHEMIVHRSQLIRLAELKGVRPRFLFPTDPQPALRPR